MESFRRLIDKLQPKEIFYLAGQSSVGSSFSMPLETFESIQGATLNLLEAIRITDPTIRFYHAGSSESFGNTSLDGATEETSFRPRSPYAVAKASAVWTVRCYREAHKLFACNGLLFNHESPRRKSQFVTAKILAAAKAIAQGTANSLELGDLSIVRDWGWAEEYVEAMWLMLQQPEPDDYVIATGKSHSLQYLVEKVFAAYDLDWHRYVRINPSLFRPNELRLSVGNPSKAKQILGWHARKSLDDIVQALCKDKPS
jgi:GDPmannose 4,6-dehydratase